MQAEDGRGPEPVHGGQPEVAVEVARVDPGQRQPVAVTGHGYAAASRARLHPGGAVVDVPVLGQHRLRRRRVQVVEGAVDEPPRDAAPAVAHPDGQVLGALDDGHLDGRVLGAVLPVVLDGGSHGVLEQLEQDVVQVGRHVGRLDVVLAAGHIRKTTNLTHQDSKNYLN